MQEVYKKVNKELDDAIKLRDAIWELDEQKDKQKVIELREKQDYMWHKAMFKREVLKARSESNGRVK